MAKRSTSWSQEKMDKWIAEGRGTGELENYKGWIDTYTYPSQGRITRLYGNKTKRIHYFMTDTETRYFLLLEWDEKGIVYDIREHFPLFNLEETIKDKADLRFDLFKDPNSGVPYILSTTFLITIRNSDGSFKYVARSVKSSLEKKLSLERLEIERRYWTAKGIEWGLVTDKEIPAIKVQNIEWVHSSLSSCDQRGLTKKDITYLSDAFLKRINLSSLPARQFTDNFDMELKLEAGTGLFVFKYLIASKKITIDLNKEINLNDSIKNFKDKEMINNKEEKSFACS